MKKRYYVLGMKPSDNDNTNPVYYLRCISCIEVYKRCKSQSSRIDSFYSHIFSGNFFYYAKDSRISNTNRGNHMQVPQLPLDIQESIIARLPAISMARFGSVSRDWYAMSCEHLASAKDAHLAIHGGEHKQQVHLIEPINNTNVVFQLGHMPTNINIIGSSNGILCFRDYEGSIYLYNPILGGEYLELPKRATIYLFDWLNYGFCFDHATSEFKVVIFVARGVQEGEVGVKTFLVETMTIPMVGGHIRTSQPWRRITSEININGNIYQYGGDPLIFVNRKFHCITGEKMITSFDIASEEIVSMPFSLNVDNHYWGDIQIGELGGRLFATCLVPPHWDMVLDLWVMKDYNDPESWTRIMINGNIITPYIVNEDEILLSRCLDQICMFHHTPSLVSIQAQPIAP